MTEKPIWHKFEQIKMEFEATIEACQEGIAIYDSNLQCLHVNTAYSKITGIPPADIIGKTGLQLVKEGFVSKSIGGLVLEKHKEISIIQTFHNGNRVLVTGKPVFDQSGQLFRIVFTARDLTRLNTLEQKLKEAEDRSERYLKQLTQYQIIQQNNPGLIANSKKIQLILEYIPSISQVDSPVLITGESGTGKEILATLIHESGHDKKAPFIKINCGAIPGELLESELFGYVKGAFTGANHVGKPGLIEIADKGTLFLDEVGELPLNLQVKLLRVLQDFEVTRLGSTKPKKVTFRLIAATNQPLMDMLKQKTFREDLYYRLNVIPLHLPPLRERIEDIHPLINSKLTELANRYGTKKTISTEAFDLLEQYHWPGNIRELMNVVERLYVMTSEDLITKGHLPTYVKLNSNKSESSKDSSLKNQVQLFEKNIITETLQTSRSLRDAAKKLKIDPSTLSRKCKSYDVTLD